MSQKRRKRRLIGSSLVLALVGAVLPAGASDFGGAHRISSWTFSFTTYGWASWVTGDLTVKGRPLEVDVSPDALIDALDWSGLPVWMSYAEARNGKLTLFNDIVYSKLAGSADFARSRQGLLTTQSLAGSVESEYQQLVIEVGAAYEVWSNGSMSSPQSTAVDLLAGGRYWRQEVEVSADLAATIAAGGNIADLEVSGGRVVARSGSVDWFDPFIGARLRHQIVPGQRVMLRGDVGGFGVGSDFSWQAMATYDWQMLVRTGYAIDAYLGYRALYVDYHRGEGTTRYEYDVLQHGPVLGLTIRF